MDNKFKKIPYLNLVPLILISFILYRLVNNPGIITGAVGKVFSIFSYLIWGFAFAYLLNPLMVFLESKFKLKRIFSILIIYLFFTALLVLSIIIMVPALVSNITQLSNNMSSYISSTKVWVLDILNNLEFEDSFNISSYIQENMENIISQTGNIVNISLNFLISKTLSMTSAVINILFGIIISIYLLSDKEGIIKRIKNICYAFLKTETTDKILTIGNRVNISFSRYITGKIVVSVIVGVICFIGLVILRVPFALLISLIIAVTNLIPYIGSIVGMVPSVIVLLFIDPIKALWALVFMLILQQADGFIISPKVIGGQLGLSPIMIIVAIIIGGALYGILGMFLAVPLFAVLKEFFDEYVERRLAEKTK